MCRFYKDFIDKVAAGRNMRAEEVARVAKGRIWTGRDAYQLGLVDELGGLTKAIALAKQMARLPQVTILCSFCRSHIVADATDSIEETKATLYWLKRLSPNLAHSNAGGPVGLLA